MDEKEFNYINVIPLVDVMLVLLTIVLTTSTFIAAGVIPVELPKASCSHAETLRTQTIEIDKKGVIYFNSHLRTLEGLKSCMTSVNKETPVLIRADREVALQLFVDVLDMVRNLGFRRVSLQTQERK